MEFYKNKNFDKFEKQFVYMDVFRDIKIFLIIMKILVLLFEGPISNNKEQRNIASSPWDALGKKDLFSISLTNMKILIIMFEGPTSNNKEKNKYCHLSPRYAPDKKIYFSISLNKYKKIYIYIYISNVFLVIYKRYKTYCILVLETGL